MFKNNEYDQEIPQSQTADKPIRQFYCNSVLSSQSKEDQNLVFKTEYRLMQVQSIAECSKGEHSAMLLTYIKQGGHSAIVSTYIKLLFVFKTSVWSIFEWPHNTGFTVFRKS